MPSSFPRLLWKQPREELFGLKVSVQELSPLRRLVQQFGEPVPAIAMSPRDTAVYLLQIGAEVEHALLVQYLYSAYSIDRAAPAPASKWLSKVRKIAREEMGHLITVQNLLMSLGAPPHLRRTRDPAPDLYPFPLRLEPLSLDAVKKYVVAESPVGNPLPGFPADVHHVGVIYAKLYSLFQPSDAPTGPFRIESGTFTDEHLSDSDFVDPAQLADRFATADEWSKGQANIYVLPDKVPEDVPAMRQAALEAIHLIAAQGEGPSTELDSHFDRFMSIYNDMTASGVSGVLKVAVDPSEATITDAKTKLWARLADVRYEVLLREIEHAVSLPRRTDLGDNDPRARLIAWAVQNSPSEMVGVIKPIAAKLTTLPTGNATGEVAGMPFRDPVSALPSDEQERWKKHRELLRTSATIAEEIGADPALTGMGQLDNIRLPFIQQQVGGQEAERVMTKTYKIHPAIGIARVGDSADAFYVCPEALGARPVEIAADGSESPLTNYKDSGYRVKRQAARFRIFEYDDDGAGNLTNPREITANDAQIEWRVTLANTKAGARMSPPPGANRPFRNPQIADRASLAITPSPRTISGASHAAVAFDDGLFRSKSVYLGELRTDGAGRLLVLGGRGQSASVPAGEPINNFTDNPNWHDDVGDGPVNATITFNNKPPITITPENSSWVIVGPPDFAPFIGGMVTMYDIAYQAAVTRGWITPPTQPSFRRDIFPAVQRAALLRWVHTFAYWDAVSRDYATLSDPAGPHALRADTFDVLRNNPLNSLDMTAVQVANFQKWVAGNFINDFAAPAAPVSIPDELDRTSLDICVGGGFFPGIEIGEFMTDVNRYIEPFRLNQAAMRAGEMSERMAIPWQADFWDCQGDWWPSQRPDTVLAHVDDTVPNAVWSDPVAGYTDMVAMFSRLGFVVPAKNSAGVDVFVETERDPSIARP